MNFRYDCKNNCIISNPKSKIFTLTKLEVANFERKLELYKLIRPGLGYSVFKLLNCFYI